MSHTFLVFHVFFPQNPRPDLAAQDEYNDGLDMNPAETQYKLEAPGPMYYRMMIRYGSRYMVHRNRIDLL